MDAIVRAPRAPSSPIDRSRLRATATNCGDGLFYNLCKQLWPENTAAHLATRAACKPRMAEYYLASGKPNARAVLAIVAEIFARFRFI